MARKVEIEITIGADGEVSLEVEGVKGRRCLDLARPFEEALGEVSERTHKPAFYQTEVAQQQSTKQQR